MRVSVYIDMDGVVSNFDKGFNQPWSEEAIVEFLDNNGFERLEPYDGASSLVSFIGDMKHQPVDFTFLSSCGNHPDRRIMEQKRHWLNKFGFMNQSLICVQHKGIKKRFATPRGILLDDTKQNIWDWRENHGYGIRVFAKEGLQVEHLEEVGIQIERQLQNPWLIHVT